MLLHLSVKARQTAISCQHVFNNFIEKQAVNMMPCVCHITVLADAGSLPGSESNRMLIAVDLMPTGVTVNTQFLKVTHSLFN